MTSHFNILKSTVSRILFASLIAGLASACASPAPKDEAKGHDYRQNHKIQVTREQVSVSITLPDQGLNLSPGDQRRFRVFLRDFVQRGRTAVTVESTLPTLAKDILIANGLRGNEIILAPDTTILAPNAVLSFTASQVVAPECGDWSSNSAFNPSNKPHSNFGCSVQRNIGKVVSDPGDFIQAQPATGGVAGRTDEAIRTHQSGAPKPSLIGQGGGVQ